ncbi:hypothetical protein BKP66_00440 [Bacillus amyloliquefaciens]|uniref:Uncharacterized protein n=1 Tax=Bacillus amyloliquefaciens TaxID=1390 RepID=A0AAP7NAS9_BACAM|nr:hypothetical protein BKP66_00440 [Bacillus amyloliquefaciens]
MLMLFKFFMKYTRTNIVTIKIEEQSLQLFDLTVLVAFYDALAWPSASTMSVIKFSFKRGPPKKCGFHTLSHFHIKKAGILLKRFQLFLLFDLCQFSGNFLSLVQMLLPSPVTPDLGHMKGISDSL